jgi:hypothetical protein
MVRLQLDAIVEPSTIIILLWGEALRPRGFPRKFPPLVAGSKKIFHIKKIFLIKNKHFSVTNIFLSY